jgi:hypothetical protein
MERTLLISMNISLTPVLEAPHKVRYASTKGSQTLWQPEGRREVAAKRFRSSENVAQLARDVPRILSPAVG